MRKWERQSWLTDSGVVTAEYRVTWRGARIYRGI